MEEGEKSSISSLGSFGKAIGKSIYRYLLTVYTQCGVGFFWNTKEILDMDPALGVLK